MSVLAGMLSGGNNVGDALAELDSRQQDAWSRIDIEEGNQFKDGLRFGRKEHSEIHGYIHRPTTRGIEDD